MGVGGSKPALLVLLSLAVQDNALVYYSSSTPANDSGAWTCNTCAGQVTTHIENPTIQVGVQVVVSEALRS